ncbi:MAG: glycosyltransferase family protein [Bacteroidia bacterium]
MNLRIFIQARMGSTRLPGKVLKTIGGKIQLQHLLDRLGAYTQNGQVVVVTTENEEDNAIAEFCSVQNVSCCRGSDWDVLGRFVKAADELHLHEDTVIIRVTADCPLHHEDVISFAIHEFMQHQLDYFSNSYAPHYEDGCDTEVFRLKTLRDAASKATLLSQREHVTPYIKDSGLYLCGYKKYDTDYRFKLSVDTINDHAAVDEVFRRFAPDTNFGIHEVVKLIQSAPEILQLNNESVINAGYAKSLANDKEVN